MINAELMAVPSSFNDVIVDQEKRNYIGDFWYERVVDLPEIDLSKEFILRFGSVTHNAKVYVNSELIGQHKGGFTPFECVMPEHLT